MKTLLRQISLVMSLVLLLGALSLMSSCRKEGGEGDSTVPETTESTEPIVLSSGGKAVYRIVRPSNPTNRSLESFKSACTISTMTLMRVWRSAMTGLCPMLTLHR